MEQITEMLKSLQIKLDEQAKELKEMKESIPKNINKNIDEKFAILEKNQEQLKDTVEEQGKKILRLESFTRRKNLIFFGVEETENSYFSLQSKITNLIITDMKVECQNADIEYVTRMGKKSEKVRPIIVTLTTMGKKIEILKNKKLIKNSSFYIKQDYPPEVLEERKNLHIQLQKEKDQGKKGYIKYNKLVILPENETEQNHKISQDRQKRVLSQSPETPHCSSKNTDNQPIKKNKMDQYIIKNKDTPAINRSHFSPHGENQTFTNK